jgi:hypothetical protein
MKILFEAYFPDPEPDPDLDPDVFKISDPDPVKHNPDPQHWL